MDVKLNRVGTILEGLLHGWNRVFNEVVVGRIDAGCSAGVCIYAIKRETLRNASMRQEEWFRRTRLCEEGRVVSPESSQEEPTPDQYYAASGQDDPLCLVLGSEG